MAWWAFAAGLALQAGAGVPGAPAPMPPASPADAIPAPGSVSVQLDGAADPSADGTSADAAFGDAVAAALGRRDFLVLPDHGRYVMEVAVLRERTGVAPVRVAGGGSAVGVAAVAVSLPSKKTRLVDLVRTTLTMRLRARDDRHLVWQAQAVTVRPQTSPVAARLVEAAFAGYPRAYAGAVSVP